MKGAFWGEKIVGTVDSKRVHFYVSLALHAPVVFFSLVFLFIWLGITRSTATRQPTVVFYFISPIDTRFMAEYINSKWYSPSCLLVDPWLQDLSTIIDVWVLFFHICIQQFVNRHPEAHRNRVSSERPKILQFWNWYMSDLQTLEDQAHWVLKQFHERIPR